MMTSIEVPHLGVNQKIMDYKKIFMASTATLSGKQQLGCLPVYVHRTDGERQLAFTAATKESIDAAFTFLELMIDGKPCVFTESAKFFNMKPNDTSIDGIRSYFFELYEVSTRAEIDGPVFARRFLTNVPGGKKLFEDKIAAIKDLDTSTKVDSFFADILPRLKKKCDTEEPSKPVQDPFVFPVQPHEEKVPGWAKDILDEINTLRDCAGSNESGFDEASLRSSSSQSLPVFAYDKPNNGSFKKM